MATGRLDRTDDTAAVLKIIATVDATEDAVTKQWQSVTISDSTSPAANKASVSAAGNLNVAVNLALPAGTANIGDVDVLTLPALVAGSANIGDVDVLTLPALVAGAANIGDVDVLTVPAPLSTTGGGTEATALRVTVASDSTGVLSVDDNGSALTVDNGGTFAVQIAANSSVNLTQIAGTAIVTGGLAGTLAVGGSQAHDAADANNNPLKMAGVAIAHGANPTAVAAADITNLYTNRAGVQFVIGGHPNIVTIELAATGAQTDVAIVTIAGGLKIVVTQAQFVTDQANSVAVAMRIGFGAVNTPTTTGVVLTHPGVVPGAIASRGDGSGILGVGADGEDLRVTATVPTGGSMRSLVSYFTIES